MRIILSYSQLKQLLKMERFERNQFATVSIGFYFIAIVCIANNNELVVMASHYLLFTLDVIVNQAILIEPTNGYYNGTYHFIARSSHEWFGMNGRSVRSSVRSICMRM